MMVATEGAKSNVRYAKEALVAIGILVFVMLIAGSAIAIRGVPAWV